MRHLSPEEIEDVRCCTKELYLNDIDAWHSRSLLSLSRPIAVSCSVLSLSASLAGICELLFNPAPVPIGLLKQGSQLLQGILVRVSAPLIGNEVVLGSCFGAGFILKLYLEIANVS